MQLTASLRLAGAYKLQKGKSLAQQAKARQTAKERAQAERERDERLVTRVQAGEWSAFDVLVNLYERALYNFVLSRHIDAETAVDITQESFIKAFKAIEGYDSGRASFKTWLYTIAYNLIRDKARRASVRARELEKAKRDLDQATRQHVDSPERNYLNRDYTDRLVGLLDEETRAIVAMKFYLDLTYDDIAQITGLNTPSVRCKLHRALKKMRALAPSEEVCAS